MSGPEGTPNGVDRLAHLRQVAEAADDNSRQWEWEHAYPQRVTRVGDVVLVAECFENPDMPSRFAEFIATFDPPTVLALVEIARALRPFVEDYDFHAADYLADRVDGEEARAFTARTVDLLIEHQRAARSALARLDSEATERGGTD